MTAPVLDIAVSTRPMPAEPTGLCGDVGLVRQADGRPLLALIDGLGHGPKAHEVAESARAEIERQDSDMPVDELMQVLIDRFRGGRGFVAALCRIDIRAGELEFCGIGNINALLFSQGHRMLPSGQGIVGQYSARPRVQRFGFSAGAVVLLHTDGISSRLRFEDFEEILAGTAQESADRMVERHGRDDDDAAVVIARRLR